MDRKELTLRGVLLGIAITAVFTAANVYLGLKVGLTFATSIPAAVISMALLARVKGVTLQENNIVQTVASSAGAMSSVIFVLPGLIIVGWWANFPFWLTFGVCAAGGVLGVMYSIPLRRALVVNSDLPYPEGVAAAEVLKVGSGTREGAGEEKASLAVLVAGALASTFYANLAATKVAAARMTPISGMAIWPSDTPKTSAARERSLARADIRDGSESIQCRPRVSKSSATRRKPPTSGNRSVKPDSPPISSQRPRASL